MKNIFLILFMSILVDLIGQNVPNKEMKAEDYNFTSFASRTKQITPELLKNTPDSLENHPEFGVLPPDAPCNNCYELLDKRTPNNRVFVENETNGIDRFYQQAYDMFNYTDNNGWVRSLDKDLYPTTSSNLYASKDQLFNTSIDLNNNYLSIEGNGYTINFHNNLKLYVNHNGSDLFLNNADWSNTTVGKDGGYITDVFPGIDLEIIALQGSFKTNFIIKSSFNIPQGDFLVIVDDVNLPLNSSYDFSNSYLNQDGNYVGRLDINNNTSNSILYHISDGVIFDSSNDRNNLLTFGYNVNNNLLEFYIPLDYINNQSRVFPIIVDPLFTTSNTQLQGSIAGSGLNNSGSWVNACVYNMTVASPANTTITNILWKFDYVANFPAYLLDGGLDFVYNGCRSPSPVGFYWYCLNAAPGTCGSGTGISMWSDWSGCVPPPQCSSYNMNFTMNFYERFNPGVCRNTYIGAGSNWIMTVEGRTIEQNAAPTSSAGTTLCNLATTNLTATGSFGVPPYSYSWTPGPIAGNPINVNAPQNTSTTYTCTITDACGRTATNSITINKSLCLPVKLTSFTAEEVNNEFVELNWVTETEVNNDFFTLERSNDGKEFIKLYEIDGSGNSNVTLSYQKIDTNPLMGISYYRLKQTDFNGDYEYSNIVTVKIDRHFGDISVYPNPLHGDGFITFNSKINGAVKVEILNVIGEKVYEKEYEIMIGSNKIKFSSKKMTQGIYFVKISDSSGTSSIKFAKN